MQSPALERMTHRACYLERTICYWKLIKINLPIIWLTQWCRICRIRIYLMSKSWAHRQINRKSKYTSPQGHKRWNILRTSGSIIRLNYAKLGWRVVVANSKMIVHMLMVSRNLTWSLLLIWIKTTRLKCAKSGMKRLQVSAHMAKNANLFMKKFFKIFKNTVKRNLIVKLKVRRIFSLMSFAVVSNILKTWMVQE